MLSLLIGFFICTFFNTPSSDSYLTFVPENKNCGALITVRITDTTATGTKISWMPRSKYIKAEILSFQYSPDDTIHPASGKIIVSFPLSSSFFPEYGDIIKIRGAFFVPDQKKYGHLLAFKDYLTSIGVKHIFKVQSIDRLNRFPFSQRFYIKAYTNIVLEILKFRNKILMNLTDNMKVEYKRTFASLFFGCKQGLSYDSKQDYMKSGVIHIFAISGLHVGILALNLFILFFFLPYRIRHFTVCSILFLYIFSTGMQPSALRAFLMILIWSLHRIYLRNISSLNTLFIAASISLICNPMNIYSVGFHYSFAVTAFLLISWKSSQEYLKFINAEINLTPFMSTKALFINNLKNKILNTIHAASVCWLSSSGMNALLGNLFIPGALICNLLILPFVWLLFCIASFNFFISFFSTFLAPFQEIILKTINILTELGTHFSSALYLGKIPLLLSIIYFTALIFLISAKSFKIFNTALAVLILTVSVIFSMKFFRTNQTVLISGNGDSPESIVTLPKISTGASVLNVGSYEKSKLIASILQNRGINSIDTLILSSTKSNVCKGASSLFLKFNIRELIIPKIKRNSYFVDKILKKAGLQHTEISFIQPNGRQYSSPIIKFETSDIIHSLQLDIPQFHLYLLSEKNKKNPRTIFIKLNNVEKIFRVKNSLNISQKNITTR